MSRDISFYDQGLVPEPSAAMQRRYDEFVTEYLRDYDDVAACRRMGYNEQYAPVYAMEFMKAPYVAKQIKLREEAEEEIDEEKEVERQSRIIKANLIREANYFGPGSSHSGRVAALAQLSKILGIEQSKIVSEHKGGVMLVPATATDVENWERVAAENQDNLHDENGTRK